VAGLPESEARKIAVTLEESWGYEYREQRKQRNESDYPSGLREGFEEDFVFGDDDDADYWDRPDILEGRPIE